MKYKTLLIVFFYLVYLFSVRILINVTFRPWLVENIGTDIWGTIVWGLIKTIHWCLPIIVYLIFFRKDFIEYLKEKFNYKFSWLYLSIFFVVWGFLTLFQKPNAPDLSFYSLFHDVLVTSIVEEFIFRGFVLDELKKSISFGRANLLQSIFFSLNHLPWLYMIGMFDDVLNLAYLLIFYIVFGLIAGYMTKKFNSVLPATFLHFVNNLLA